MKPEAVRNFLGIYYLGTTFVLGAYILLCKGTWLLNIDKEEATSAFQIVVPTFLAQLTIMFRWFANPPTSSKRQPLIPKWIVVGPPILVLLLFIVTIVFVMIDQGRDLDESVFKNAVTFAVSILGATTAFITVRMFGQQQGQ